MALFLKHYRRGQISEVAIKGLVQQVDYHTLTIEILAKTAQRQRLPARRLQRAIADDVAAHVNVDHARGKIEKVRAYDEAFFNELVRRVTALQQAGLKEKNIVRDDCPPIHPYRGG